MSVRLKGELVLNIPRRIRAGFRVAAAASLFVSLVVLRFVDSSVAQAWPAPAVCRASQLTMTIDTGHGAYAAAGNHGVAFVFRNGGAGACTLQGYPRFRFNPASYKGQKTTITHNCCSEIFATVAPRRVIIDPGKTTSFGLEYGDAYNQGDPSAGPCLTDRANVWLPVQPRPHSVAFSAPLSINFCFANFHFGVTSLQRGSVPKQDNG